MRLVCLLIALSIDYHHFQKDGDDMFTRKGVFSFITKDWYVSFFHMHYTLLWTLSKRVLTESDIFRREKDILFRAATLIQEAIQIGKQTGDPTMDELTEIVLNVDDRECWYYYFVDHANRLLFWVDPVNPRDDLGTDVQGINEYSHISMFDTHCFLSLTCV